MPDALGRLDRASAASHQSTSIDANVVAATLLQIYLEVLSISAREIRLLNTPKRSYNDIEARYEQDLNIEYLGKLGHMPHSCHGLFYK
jgi:hypothetical protein